MPFLRVAVPVPLYRYFDYLPVPTWNLAQLVPGMRLRVPFGKRELVGILIEVLSTTAVPTSQLKTALALLDAEPLLTPMLLQLAQFASHYYQHPPGEVFNCLLPSLLRKGKPGVVRKPTMAANASMQLPNYTLNDAQRSAVQMVNATQTFQTFLLDGVTGSGKTEVYLHCIEAIIAEGKQALVLVPEIGLTPQLLMRFQTRFCVPIAVLHSDLTERERLNAWLEAKAGRLTIIIGTRSALFTPLLKPGIIIIDEEHDSSFKQHEGLRYHARDLAIVRARLENVPIILGSATPALESLHNSAIGRYTLLNLPARAGSAVQPVFQLIDMRQQILEGGLTPALLTNIQRHLAQGGQVLLFLNRRGFAPVWFCRTCSWSAQCRRCDVKLTYHRTQAPVLWCHHCGAQHVPEAQCPQCQQTTLAPLGLGTQRLEQTLRKYFAINGVVRIDRDSTRRKGALDALLETVHTGENRILIGTQMLAKGHHFPEVTLVAIVDADAGLFSADFRATERFAQLLLQVAGRAGRAERAGEVCIQTYNPQQPLLTLLIEQGYNAFARAALAERRHLRLPPYTHAALFRAEATTAAAPLKFLTELHELALAQSQRGVEILGPTPALIERSVGRYRAQLLLLASERHALHALTNFLMASIKDLTSSKRVRWIVDIDPLEAV